jgi:hypothetical protein
MKLQSTALFFGLVALVAAAVTPLRTTALAEGNTRRAFDAPIVFQAAGPTALSVVGTVDQFRAALGGANNGNGPSQPTGRREINWDGGGTTTSVGGTPFTVFLNNRGALLTTPGSGFVQAPPAGLADTFGNPSYTTTFQPFSLQRLFSPIRSNVTELRFFVPGGTNIPATTTGFGLVLSDIDQPDGSGPAGKRGNRGASTYIEYYDAYAQLLFSSVVPASPGDATFSFFAVLFDTARIAGVRITTGDLAPGADDEENHDIVVMDDFVYGEPRGGQ